MNAITIFSAFLQGLGIVAISMRLHEMAIGQCETKRCERTAAAATFVVGVVVSMGFPLTFAPGIVFDLRHVFLTIAAAFGGIPSALLTAGAASLFRLWIGGAGIEAGLAGIAVSSVAGLGLAALYRGRELNLARLCLLGLASSLSLATVFLLPWTIAIETFRHIAVPFIAINLFGVLIAGETLNKYRLRRVRERALVRDTATDALTGLANRRAFDLRAPQMARAEMLRSGKYAIMVVDVDNFKGINDTFGHTSGDAVLRRISDIVAAGARTDDLVARFGGEEIVLVLPGCDGPRSQIVADRIRSGVEDATFEIRGVKLKVTVSVGFIVVDDPDLPFWRAFNEADAALFRAKTGGRNRIEQALAA